MAKKILSALLCSCMVAGMLAGCGNTGDKESTPVSSQTEKESEVSEQVSESEEVKELDPVELKWWVIKSANSEDEDLVEEAVNEYLAEVLPNTTVDITFFTTADQVEQLNKALSSGESVDVAWFGWYHNLENMVSMGAMTQIDDLLAEYGQGVVETLGENVIDMHRASDGNAYFLPCWQGLGTNRNGIFVPQEYVDMMDDDWAKETQELMYEAYDTPFWTEEGQAIHMEVADKWEELLATLKDAGKLRNGINMRNNPIDNLWGQDNTWDSAFQNTHIRLVDDTYYVIGRYSLDSLYLPAFQLRNEWYEKGYIREDADSYSWPQDNWKSLPEDQWFVFELIDAVSDSAAAVESANMGVELACFYLNKELELSTGFATGMFIPSTSENPDRAMMLLDVIYTDPTIHRLMSYGIEGTHYNLDDKGVVVPVEGSEYVGCFNWGIGTCEHSLPTTEAQIGYYEGIKAAEETAKESPLADFKYVQSDDAKVIQTNLTAALAAYGLTYKMNNDEIVDNRTQVYQAAMDNGYDKLVDEVVEQLTEYAEAKGRKVVLVGY